MNLNKIYFAGHAGRDAELIKTKTGTEMARVSVCSSEKMKDGKTVSTWVSVLATGGWAKYGASIKKGDTVFCSGKLSV